MKPVFAPDARVLMKDGIVFYEQDLLKIEYQFTGDMDLEVDLDYYSSGFGILYEKVSHSTKKGEDSVLFKVGNDTFSVYRKQYNKEERLLYTTCDYSPIRENSKLKFSKKNGVFQLSENGKLLNRFVLPVDFKEYHVYLYSSEGNRIKRLEINGPAPDAWVTNTENTNGGRIEFTRDQIRIENSKNDAEVEQHDIFLEKGTYFLDYLVSQGGVESVLFLSSERKFKDSRKNILNQDGSFTLEEDDYVSLKFKSRDAVIKNITIKTSPYGSYVSTGAIIKSSTGSHFDVFIDKVKKARWTGIIHRIPLTAGLDAQHSLIESSIRKYMLNEGSALIGSECYYELDILEMRLTVKNSGNIILSQIDISAGPSDEFLRVFKNLDAAISSLVIINNEDQEIDILLQETYKTFVPSTIRSPIICLDEDEEPLDLSSSYREKINEGRSQYVFTNWEREWFSPEKELHLKNATRKNLDSVVVYLIKGDVDWDKFYGIKNSIHDISLFNDNNVVLHPDQYEVDESRRIVIINSVINDTDLIVVDYLKEDSYAINKNYELGMYEVDISASEKKITVMYEKENPEENSSNKYKKIDIDTDVSQYVILRK